MSFKQLHLRTLNLAMILTFVLGLVGCKWNLGKNLSFGEKNPPAGRAGINLNEFDCLKTIDKKIVAYFKGELHASDVSLQFKCVDSALKKFEFFANDNASFNDGSYSAIGLMTFLNKHYLAADNLLTESFVKEIMAVKVVVLGGLNDRFTPKEYKSIFDFLSFAERQAILNLPHIRVHRMLGSDMIKNATLTEVETATAQLRQTGVELSQRLVKTGNLYDLARLENLINELKVYLKWDLSQKRPWTPSQIVTVIKAVKEVVTGESSSQVKAVDWLTIIDSLTRFYGMYLNYRILVEQQDFTYGEPLNAFIALANDFLSVIYDVADRLPGQYISFQSSDSLFRSLELVDELRFGNEKLRASSVSAVYRQIVGYGLINRDEKNIGSVEGLGISEIKEFKYEFDLWANAQLYLTVAMEKALGMFDLNSIFTQQNNKQVVKNLDLSETLLNMITVGDGANPVISDIVTKMRPLFKQGDDRVHITHLEDLPKIGVIHNVHNLTRMNVARSFVRLLIRSFAEEKKRAQAMLGLTEAEAIKSMEISKPFIEDIKFLDPRSTNSGQRIFSEGNLFTFSGDGANYEAQDDTRLLTQYELAELLALMWSGSKIQSKLYTSIRESCRADGVPDGEPDGAFKNPKIERQCFAKYFAKSEFKDFSNLPKMVVSINNLSDKNMALFLAYLQDMSRGQNSTDSHIEYGEIAVMNTGLHYTEVVFSLFDTNRDSVLDRFEVMNAYPRFHGYLKRTIESAIGKSQTTKELKAIFAFLVKEKRLPKWHDVLTLNNFKSKVSEDVFAVESNPPKIGLLTRMGFVHVLKVLAESGRKE